MSSTLPLINRIAIVTGAGRGIGAATARTLAKAGARVVIASRTESELREVASSIEQEVGEKRVLPIRADISMEEDVQDLFKLTVNEFGTVDILVNNAATTLMKEMTEITQDEWDRVMAINVRGPFLCAREAFRRMKLKGAGGSIINISSLAGVRGTDKFPGLSSYVTSKFAITGMTESLAVEGKPHGIRVNCIAPGAVDTEMLRQAAPHLKTNTKPEDIAKLILFLADPQQSGSMNGSVLEVFSNA